MNISLNPFVRKQCLEELWKIRENVIPAVIKLLKAKFNDFNNHINEKMQWRDSQYWTEEANYGNEELLAIAEELLAIAKHCQQPFTYDSFDQSKIARQWKSFTNFVTSYYPQLPSARDLWKRVLNCRKNEFPNLCENWKLDIIKCKLAIQVFDLENDILS